MRLSAMRWILAAAMAMAMAIAVVTSPGKIEKLDEEGLSWLRNQATPAVVMLHPPGACVDCTKLGEFWGMVASRRPRQVYEIDCASDLELCSLFLKWIDPGQPTLIGWTGRAFTDPYRGPRNLDGLSRWVQSILAGMGDKETRTLREIVESATGLDVRSDAPVLLKFGGTANGGACPGCEELENVWKHLPAKHPGLVARTIDCEKSPSVCLAMGAKPKNLAIGIYNRDGSGVLEWYQGPRNTYALELWVAEHTPRATDGRQMHRNFDNLYLTMAWAGNSGTGSGTGSTLTGNSLYLNYLEDLLKDKGKNIRSIVDVGCGDFTFMQHLDLGDITYHGYDVSAVAIARARKTVEDLEDDGSGYDPEKHRSITLSVSEPNQEYEAADLVIVKDVLQHLPLEDALQVTNQLSKFRYAVLVNDGNPDLPNVDVDHVTGLPLVPGGFRSLDVQQAPFHLKCAEFHELHKHTNSVIPGASKKTCLLVNNEAYAQAPKQTPSGGGGYSEL